MKSKLHQNKQFILASLIFSIFGTGAAFALPYTPTDQELDPSCAPGATDCYVSIFPDQTANTGKLLFTDGTNPIWADDLIYSTANGGRLSIGSMTRVGSTGPGIYDSSVFPAFAVYDQNEPTVEGYLSVFHSAVNGATGVVHRYLNQRGTDPTNPSQVLAGDYAYREQVSSYGTGGGFTASYSARELIYVADSTINNAPNILHSLRSGSQNAHTTINLLPSGATIGNMNAVTYSSTALARLAVIGSGATSATYTAQFHNSTGTSNSLVIRDDGRVGIGTDSPLYKLHVTSGSGVKGFLSDVTYTTTAATDYLNRFSGVLTTRGTASDVTVVNSFDTSVIAQAGATETVHYLKLQPSTLTFPNSSSSFYGLTINYNNPFSNVDKDRFNHLRLEGSNANIYLKGSTSGSVADNVQIYFGDSSGVLYAFRKNSTTFSFNQTNSTGLTFNSKWEYRSGNLGAGAPNHKFWGDVAAGNGRYTIGFGDNSGSSLYSGFATNGSLYLSNTSLASTVDAVLHVRGAGSTSSTYTAQFHNSTGTNNAFVIRDDGFVGIGASAPSSAEKLRVNGSTLINLSSDGGLSLFQGFSNGTGSALWVSSSYVGAVSGTVPLARVTGGSTDLGTLTSETATYFQVEYGRNPGLAQPTFTGEANLARLTTASSSTLGNSSSGTYNGLKIDPRINQSGSGITRGIYLNPTITSAADYRAIESTAGRVIFNSDTASNYNTTLFNDGNNDNRWGLLIQAGADTPSANKWIQFNDGDGTDQGSICYTGGQANICAPSDIRLKQNITDTTLSLNTLLDIKVKDFTYISDSTNTTIHGFIAQELNEVYPSAVSVPHDESTDFYRVSYAQLTPLIIKSIQEINANFTSLDASKEGTLGYLITEFLRNTVAFIKGVKTDRVESKEFCTTNGTCLSETDIENLLQMSHQFNGNIQAPAPSGNQPEDDSSVEEDPEEDSNDTIPNDDSSGGDEDAQPEDTTEME